ncbi:hypothetical protein MIMGU_mgv1a023163mg [Erythranthe guttata]|uniref:RNase H type-1 domain-containing protein n=1 Tax=Erythranthe guttata TaxID=4155 RepID=A0A022R6S1_ERYGU|nr:hypothetical protein MIMGU_mgv1a023163mg [Erythranthe guttata]
MEVKPSAMDNDYEIAFKLQFDEVLEGDNYTFGPSCLARFHFWSPLFQILEEELLEHYRLETSMKAMRLDISREMHDRAFAFELSNLPEEHRKKTGENFNRPHGEGLADETVGGIGVAILDGSNTLVFELGKTFDWNGAETNYKVIELKALIEGLEIAVSLELRTITIVSDNPCIFGHVRYLIQILWIIGLISGV